VGLLNPVKLKLHEDISIYAWLFFEYPVAAFWIQRHEKILSASVSEKLSIMAI
jgi:hypothetical protein